MAHRKGPGFSARPTLKIDLSAIKANYKSLQKRVGDARIGASVKADAYGLGAEKVGRALYGAGCRTFFVATAGEGSTLRRAVGDNCSIYVLNGPAPRDIALIFGANLKPVINSMEQAQLWAEHADNARHAPFSALHVDTGINRLGMPAAEFETLCANKKLRHSLNLDLVMSHLACSAISDHPMNAEQLKRFKAASARFPDTTLSFANTGGIYLGRKYHFDMVRPGIGLYGGKATTMPKQESTTPVVTLNVPILQIRTIQKGESVGYNATFVAARDMKIATIGGGYADGIPVSASGPEGRINNAAMINGETVPIVGRVSMDLTTLDITGMKKPPVIGETACFRGDQLEADAANADTLNYELLVRLGTHRCKREYD